MPIGARQSINITTDTDTTTMNDLDSSSNMPVMLPVLPLSKRVHFLIDDREVIKTGTHTGTNSVSVSQAIAITATTPSVTKADTRGMYVCICVYYQMIAVATSHLTTTHYIRRDSVPYSTTCKWHFTLISYGCYYNDNTNM
jgi:hypothetical protein